MTPNLDYTAKELFNKLRTRFSNVKLGDEASNVTKVPSKARFFDFAYNDNGADLGRVTISLEDSNPDEDSSKPSLNVIYGSDLIADLDPATKNQWYSFLRSLREFARTHWLMFDIRDIEKSQLTKRDYAFLSGSKGEKQMSESKLYGTNRTSWQDIGNAKIVIKHSRPINIDLPQGRSLNIESIYIENIEGERFKFNGSLTAARAMARHVSEGGATYDEIGKHITGLNEELGKLRHFKNYVQRHGALSENFSDLTTRVLTRIEDIKSELHTLQRESGYLSYKEQFQPPTSKDVPEDLMNDWVDKLTLRSFNEELKDVFPYLYNLVEAPVADIEFSDIVGEDAIENNIEDQEKELPESTEFENLVSSISPEHEVIEADPYEGNEFAQIVRELQAKGATPLTSFTTAEGQEYTLADVMERAGLAVEDFFSEQSFQKNRFDDLENKFKNKYHDLEDKLGFKDRNNATNAAWLADIERRQKEKDQNSQRDQDKLDYEFQFKQQRDRDWADQDNALQGQYLQWKKDYDDHSNALQGQHLQWRKEKDQLDNEIRVLRAKFDMDQDAKTFDLLRNRIDRYNRLSQNPEWQSAMVQQVGKEGVAEGEDQVVKSKGKVLPNTGNPVKDVKEFVESFFDAETGKFPKGETGVMVAVDKKFGEGAVPVAKKVIEMLKVKSEQMRIRELAGMVKKY